MSAHADKPSIPFANISIDLFLWFPSALADWVDKKSCLMNLPGDVTTRKYWIGGI